MNPFQKILAVLIIGPYVAFCAIRDVIAEVRAA